MEINFPETVYNFVLVISIERYSHLVQHIYDILYILDHWPKGRVKSERTTHPELQAEIEKGPVAKRKERWMMITTVPTASLPLANNLGA